jgi:hypothetical protein
MAVVRERMAAKASRPAPLGGDVVVYLPTNGRELQRPVILHREDV